MQANIDIISGCKIVKYEDDIWQFLDSAKEICFHTYNQELRHCCDRIESEIGSCKYKITNFFYKFKIILSMILLMMLLAAGGGVAYFVLSQNEPIEEENAVKKSIISCLDLNKNETEDDTNCEKTNSCIQEILLRNITCYTNSTIYTDAEVDGVIMFVCSLYANYTYNLWPMICKKVYNISRTESLVVFTPSITNSKSVTMPPTRSLSSSLTQMILPTKSLSSSLINTISLTSSVSDSSTDIISKSYSSSISSNSTVSIAKSFSSSIIKSQSISETKTIITILICLIDPCLGIALGFDFNNKLGIKCTSGININKYCGSDCLSSSANLPSYCTTNTNYINPVSKEVVDYWKNGVNLAGFLRYPSDSSNQGYSCGSWFALYMETANLKKYLKFESFTSDSNGPYYVFGVYDNDIRGRSCGRDCPSLGDNCGMISYNNQGHALHKDGIYFI